MTVEGDGGPGVPPGRPIEASSARQGRRTNRMVWVMTTSIALVALLFVAIWAIHLGPGANHVGRVTHADAQLFRQPIPGGKPAPAKAE
jgi:hypothetical protein